MRTLLRHGPTPPRLLVLAIASAIGVVSAGAGCGPPAQVREARAARYVGARSQVLDAVAAALAKEHPIESTDPEHGVFVTRGTWFERGGFHELRSEQSVHGQPEMVSSVHDGSVRVAFVVGVVGTGPSSYRVVIEPSVDEHRKGFAGLYHMKPDDPELPGWVRGKVDRLQLALHHRLAGLRFAPPGATTPAH